MFAGAALSHKEPYWPYEQGSAEILSLSCGEAPATIELSSQSAELWFGGARSKFHRDYDTRSLDHLIYEKVRPGDPDPNRDLSADIAEPVFEFDRLQFVDLGNVRLDIGGKRYHCIIVSQGAETGSVERTTQGQGSGSD